MKILNQKKFKNFYLLIIILVVGCAPLQERVRRLAGRSVDHLEKHRDHAVSQHAACSASDCFDVILAIGGNRSGDPFLGKHFEVFQANVTQRFIVFYAVPNQIDTTEVAVFIKSESQGSLIEIVSLSSTAQEKVAKVVFEELKANRF